MMDALKKRFQTNALEPVTLRGRLALTEEQLQAVLQERTVDPQTQTVTLSEKDLVRALRGASDDGTAPTAASMSRLEVVQNYCKGLTDGERCLRGEMPEHDHDGDSPLHDHDCDADEYGNGHPPTPATSEVTSAALKARMPGYIASVLEEQSLLDPASSSPLKGPGAQLTADEVSSKAVFPTLKLPPGRTVRSRPSTSTTHW